MHNDKERSVRNVRHALTSSTVDEDGLYIACSQGFRYSHLSARVHHISFILKRSYFKIIRKRCSGDNQRRLKVAYCEISARSSSLVVDLWIDKRSSLVS